MVSDSIRVTKLSLREAARGYLISLKASRYVEAMEMSLRLFADYAEARDYHNSLDFLRKGLDKV